jgi:acetoin utilization protein AcuA
LSKVEQARPLAVAPDGVLIEVLSHEGSSGEVYLRRRVPAAQLEQMHLAEGLGIFFRYNREAQQETLLTIAAMPNGNVVIAHTAEDEIAGYITTHPVDQHERWASLNQPSAVNPDGRLYVCEFGAIEVSRAWRRIGLSRALMQAAFEGDTWFDDKIAVSLEFAWHWDYEQLGVGKYTYRNILKKVIASGGFVQMDTDDPNILMDSANMFMVRIGPRVPTHVQQHFFSLLHKDNRWGF